MDTTESLGPPLRHGMLDLFSGKHGLYRCPECPHIGPLVGGRGDFTSPIVIVGESPGQHEAREGAPFVGPSGEILESCVPEDTPIWLTNALMCYPAKGKDMQKLKTACMACRTRLIQEILAHPRKMIIALGNAAVWSLTGNYSIKITAERGRLIKSPLAEIGIMPVIHPAALMHGTRSSYKQLRDDIHKAFSLYRGELKRTCIEPELIVCDTEEKVRDTVELLLQHELLWGDIETGGFSRRKDVILSLGVCYDPHTVYIFPDSVLQWVRKCGLFDHKNVKWCWHNGKFDIAFLRRDGMNAIVDEDTMLLSYCLNENPGSHGLEGLSVDLIGAEPYKDVLKPWAPKKADSYSKAPRSELYKYQAKDVSYTCQIFHLLHPRVMGDEHLSKLYTKLLIPASELLYHVEARGMLVDLKQVASNEQDLTAEVAAAKAKLYEAVGYHVNPNSPYQVADLLFGRMELKSKHRNTRKETLAKLPQVPAVKAIGEFRKAARSKSSNTVGLLRAVEDDGRVHPTALIHGTVTGRLAMREPNVHSTPREARLRGSFIAPPGFVLVEFDLNQAELRSLACMSGDEFLCKVYIDGTRSLHDEVAKDMYGIDFTSEDKMRAKALNFGIVYGRQGPSIAEEFGLPVEEGIRMVDSWFIRSWGAKRFIDWCRAAPRRRQAIVTCFGRKRRFGLVTKQNLQSLQNEAANFPHQSVASDITLYTAIVVRERLLALGAYIVNLVHDSILVECPEHPEVIAEVKEIVLKQMQETPKLWGLNRVPFKAEPKEGTRWGSLKQKKAA